MSADINLPEEAAPVLAEPAALHEDDALHGQLRRISELVVAQRLPEAELELLRAQADAPHDLRVLKLLALVRFKLGRLAEARQIYQEAVHIAPEDAAIRLNLGLIALKLDWFDEAVVELETTVRLRPDDRRAWSYLGYACARTGARGQAAAAFRRAGQHELAAEMERVVTPPSTAAEVEGVAAVEHSRSPDPDTDTPRPELRTQVLDAMIPALSGPVFGSGEIVSLSSFALARMIEPVPVAEPAALAWLGQGVLHFAAHRDTYVRESALLAAPGGVELLPAKRRIRAQILDESLTAQGQRFLRLAGKGDLCLAPWCEGCVLYALTLERDVLYLREQNVVAWGDELVWEWGRVPGDGPAMLQFRGSGRLVMTVAPDELVAMRLGEGESLAVLGRRLIGWVGRVVAQGGAGRDNDPGNTYVTCTGVGVVWLSKHGEPPQPNHQSAQPRDDGPGPDRSGRPVLHR
ncbi:MAG TPA: tetratricopeptide repeat protein [Polyangia bacterium]